MTDALAIYNRLQKIHVLLDDGDRRSLDTVVMSPSQYNLLQHLYDKGRDSGLTVGELANWLICTPSNATRMVQRLEQQGLVELHRDLKDRRLVWVSLTEVGRTRFQQARVAHTTSVARRLHGLEKSKLDALDALTQHIVDSLERDLVENRRSNGKD